MDTIAWIYQLMDQLYDADREDLISLIYNHSGVCLSGNLEAAESSYQQLLLAAEELKIPWLEVYARHWYLQHQLCTQNNVNVGLPEAVRLLEIAHRDENKDCPQSICAVQDLGIAYGCADGPGYARERRQVSAEALERINPRWPCFECISTEYAQALMDEEKPREAIEFLDAQRRRMENPQDASSEFQRIRARAYLKIGENERALRIVAEEDPNTGESGDVVRRILHAIALARTGKPKEALRVLPSTATIRRLPSTSVTWARALLEMNDFGAMRPEELLEQIAPLDEFARGLLERGGVRPAFNVCDVAVEACLRCDRPEEARRGVELLREILPRLRKPCGADTRLAEWEEKLA